MTSPTARAVYSEIRNNLRGLQLSDQWFPTWQPVLAANICIAIMLGSYGSCPKVWSELFFALK